MNVFDTTTPLDTDAPLIVLVIDEVAQYATIPAAAAHEKLQGRARSGKSISGTVPRLYLQELSRSAGNALTEQQARHIKRLLNRTTADHLTGTA